MQETPPPGHMLHRLLCSSKYSGRPSYFSSNRGLRGLVAPPRSKSASVERPFPRIAPRLSCLHGILVIATSVSAALAVRAAGAPAANAADRVARGDAVGIIVVVPVGMTSADAARRQGYVAGRDVSAGPAGAARALGSLLWGRRPRAGRPRLCHRRGRGGGPDRAGRAVASGRHVALVLSHVVRRASAHGRRARPGADVAAVLAFGQKQRLPGLRRRLAARAGAGAGRPVPRRVAAARVVLERVVQLPAPRGPGLAVACQGGRGRGVALRQRRVVAGVPYLLHRTLHLDDAVAAVGELVGERGPPLEKRGVVLLARGARPVVLDHGVCQGGAGRCTDGGGADDARDAGGRDAPRVLSG